MDDATAAARGAERTGPVNNSGTNNTIRATIMIAPVSRSFTWTTHDAGETEEAKHSAAESSARPLVYPKPLQRRTDGVHRAAHDDAVTGLRLAASELAAFGHGPGKLEGSTRGHKSRRKLAHQIGHTNIVRHVFGKLGNNMA